MSIFALNFDQKAVELMPPDKRSSASVAWMRSLLSQNQYNHTDIFVDYKTGSTYPYWSNLGTYSVGNRVIYGQSVYESLIDSNTNLPTDTNSWRVYQPSFIGADERVMYRGEKLIFEYALNKRFATVFRQPPLVSDIYLGTNSLGIQPFVTGGSEFNSSASYFDFTYDFVINAYTIGVQNNFTLYIPLAVYNALSVDPQSREKIVREFADRYIVVGVGYNIQTY